MAKACPAVDVRPRSVDVMLALVDDYSPTAVEERDTFVRVFFSTPAARDAAHAALVRAGHPTATIDVDDEDWPRRSQENLAPVSVGRITIRPKPRSRTSDIDAITIVIAPSMGFGTGHHATTRLCLAALQAVELTGKVVLDVGTGSGVLSIAADRLGARRTVGIDSDGDAIQSARDNLALNPGARHVEFRIADLASFRQVPPADVVTANLTGSQLVREARRLVSAVRPEGIVIVSGLLVEERAAVVGAFAPAALSWEQHEDEWAGLAFRLPPVK